MKNYLDCTKNYSKEKLLNAANHIKSGNLVLFPTETVYGIGADGLNEKAVKKIFEAKGRKTDNPLILHVSNKDMIDTFAIIENEIEQKLIDTFFPGALTIVLKKKDIVPNIVSGNLDTVGIRMPKNKIAIDLISLSNTPIAAPSANISGKPSGTNIQNIFDELHNKVSYIIDGGDTDIGVESTVVRVIDGNIHILRPGKITEKDLKKVHPNVIIDSHILGTLNLNDKVLSPGMKYKHYAPNTKCILVYSKNKDKLIKKIQELEIDNKNSLVLTKTKNQKYFKNSLSMGDDLDSISHNLFRMLREIDTYKYDLVIIEGVKPEGLGLAIMNRLIRACNHNFIEI